MSHIPSQRDGSELTNDRASPRSGYRLLMSDNPVSPETDLELAQTAKATAEWVVPPELSTAAAQPVAPAGFLAGWLSTMNSSAVLETVIPPPITVVPLRHSAVTVRVEPAPTDAAPEA